jgi:hypothetical protein
MRARTWVVGALALFAVAAAGCKNPEVKGPRGRTVKASIAEFDPNAIADLNLGDGGGGSERPDDYQVSQVLQSSFPAMDECVASYKKRRNLGEDSQLKGDLDIAVKLNPTSPTPLGVNATLPKKYEGDEELKTCIREAVAGGKYPTYDGPPIVAEMSTQLDAGSVWEEE